MLSTDSAGSLAAGQSSRPPPGGAAAAARDELFRRIYDEHARYVWRCARRLGVAPANLDDAVQDVFLVVHRRLDEYEPRAFDRAWLYAITVRVARDYRRTFARKGRALEPLEPEAPVADPGPTPADAAARAEGVRLLETLLEQLDEDRREVFVLADLEGMTVAQIAQILGQNPNTLASRLRAARADFERLVARLNRRSS